MPLLPGKSAIGRNIEELAVNSKTGKPRPMKQRVAIALDEARRTGAHIPERKRYGGAKAHGGSKPKRYGGK